MRANYVLSDLWENVMCLRLKSNQFRLSRLICLSDSYI